MERRDSARLTPREGRQFAFPVGIAFFVLAGVLYWWREHAVAGAVVGGLGATLVTAGLVIPAYLGPVQRAWMALAYALSKVTTPVFMSVVYFAVLTPTGLVRRGIGSNPIRHAPNDDSYWAERPDSQRRSDLQRQF